MEEKGFVVRTERGTRIGDGTIITLEQAGTRYTLAPELAYVREVVISPDGEECVGKWVKVMDEKPEEVCRVCGHPCKNTNFKGYVCVAWLPHLPCTEEGCDPDPKHGPTL